MKKIILVHLVLLVAASHLALRSQPLIGSDLNVGPSNTNANTFDYSASLSWWSGAIGVRNYIAADRSLAVGGDNQLWYTHATFLLGDSNTASGNGFGDVTNSFAVGTSNFLGGANCAIVGIANSAESTQLGYDENNNPVGTPTAISSLIVGNSNSNCGTATLIVGENNVFGYRTDFSAVYSGTILGRGLVSYWDYSLILGRYNDLTVPDTAGLAFAIGNGTNANNRSNALTVYNNGDAVFQGVVHVAPGGDIPMFGQTP